MRKQIVVSIALCVLALVSVAAQEPGPWPPAGVFLMGRDQVVAPKVVSDLANHYTAAAIRARVQGVVVLQAVVLADGTVGEVRVVKPLGYGLDEAAVATAKGWRFTPGTKDGVAVPVAITMNLAFSIPGVPPPMTLPDGFTEESDTTAPPIALHDDAIDEGGVTIHFAYPDRWTVKKDPAPGQAATLSSASQTRTMMIMRPLTLPAALELPMPIGKLQAFSDFMAKTLLGRNGGPPVEPLGVGQSPLGTSHWVWIETQLTSMQNPAIPPEALALMQQMFSGGRMWAFTTGKGTSAVTIICTALTQRGRSDADLQAERHQAIAEFTAMLKRTSIESR